MILTFFDDEESPVGDDFVVDGNDHVVDDVDYLKDGE